MNNKKRKELKDRLRRSSFRSRFKLNPKDTSYLREKGTGLIREHAFVFVRNRIAPASPKNDGKQTPMRGHPVFVAQHATATCCRGCLEKWHGIRKSTELTEPQIDDVVDMIMFWIHDRVQARLNCKYR
jgi:hypothetical protein